MKKICKAQAILKALSTVTHSSASLSGKCKTKNNRRRITSGNWTWQCFAILEGLAEAGQIWSRHQHYQKKVTWSWWAVPKLKQKREPLAKVEQASVMQNQGTCLLDCLPPSLPTGAVCYLGHCTQRAVVCTLKAMNKMVTLECHQLRLVQWLSTQPWKVSLGHSFSALWSILVPVQGFSLFVCLFVLGVFLVREKGQKLWIKKVP